MSVGIEQLKEVLDNLPTLTERLQTWNKIIKDLDLNERMFISECNLALCYKEDFVVNIDLLKSNLDVISSYVENHKLLFSKLIERLEIPIKAYKEKIEEIEYGGFRIKVREFASKSHRDNIDKAEGLAIGYFSQFNPNSGIDKKKYISQCESLITPFLFQTPMFANCAGQAKRDIYSQEFKGWNPNDYVIIFCKKLKELFK